MSFILDALKKSESDRQRESRPDNLFVPSGSPESPRNRWIWIVGILLAVNIAVLSYLLLRPQAEPAGAAGVTRPETAPVVQQEQDPVTFKEIVNDVRANKPAETASPEASEIAPAPETSRAFQVADPVPVPVAARTSPSTATQAYKTFNEMRAEGSVQLPDLHLDIHVYSETPADRFVFVNMSKYKEKSTLGEGPVVAEIVPEGVILEHSGLQFLLPRE